VTAKKKNARERGHKNRPAQDYIPLLDDRRGKEDLHVESPLPADFKEAFTGIKVDGLWYLAFSSAQARVDAQFAEVGRVRIPRLRISLNPKVTLDIYGSHLDQPDDLKKTHLVHNPTVFQPILVEDYGVVPPLWATVLVASTPSDWRVVYDKAMLLKGEPTKTIFQGVAKDPDLSLMLGLVYDVLNTSEDFDTKLPPPLDKFSEPPFRRRIGEALLDFIVPAIRSRDFEKLRLLEKCVQFYNPPSKTKIERFAETLKRLCQKNNRLPSAPEFYSAIVAGNHKLKESKFYSDLHDLGMGWLTRKHSKKTPVGQETK
jgi:hypothetical protein